MIFAIYTKRDDPEKVIFDVELANPPSGTFQDYDCEAVFEATHGEIISRDMSKPALTVRRDDDDLLDRHMYAETVLRDYCEYPAHLIKRWHKSQT